jgi:hypothetical protein
MRRARYTVEVEGRDPQVILAYSPQSAADFYRRRGYDVRNVVKGDYRRVAAPPRPTPQGGGYRVDQKALKAAIALLDIKLPVKVRFNARVGDTNGNYRFRNGGHDIMLKSYHTAEQASSTLWHELTHAMQAERCGGTIEDWREVHREQKRYTYKQRPIEIEARKMSADMADCPLTTAL